MKLRRTLSAESGDFKGAPKRREQQRAIETRQMILEAALSEFAERGFDAASIRNIAMRIWTAASANNLSLSHQGNIVEGGGLNTLSQRSARCGMKSPDDKNLSPMESLRAKYSALLRFTVAHPDFSPFHVARKPARQPPTALARKHHPLADNETTPAQIRSHSDGTSFPKAIPS